MTENFQWEQVDYPSDDRITLENLRMSQVTTASLDDIVFATNLMTEGEEWYLAKLLYLLDRRDIYQPLLTKIALVNHLDYDEVLKHAQDQTVGPVEPPSLEKMIEILEQIQIGVQEEPE